MYASLQMLINILNLRENIAEAEPFKTSSQRCKPQRQHVQETANAVVLMMCIVMVIIGQYIKVMNSSLPARNLAHGYNG